MTNNGWTITRQQQNYQKLNHNNEYFFDGRISVSDLLSDDSRIEMLLFCPIDYIDYYYAWPIDSLKRDTSDKDDRQ